MTAVEIITVVEATAALAISLFALKHTRRTADATVRQTALNEAAAADAAEQQRRRQRDAELEYARRLYAIARPLELAMGTLASTQNTQSWGGILTSDLWRAFESAATAAGKLPFAAELKGELDATGTFFGPFRVDPSNRSQVLVGLNAITQRIRPELRIRGGEASFPSEADVVARFTRS